MTPRLTAWLALLLAFGVPHPSRTQESPLPNSTELVPIPGEERSRLGFDRLGVDFWGVGPRFDPRGADFSKWLTHYSREVLRNWVIPQASLMGIRGHVEIEFTANRDGSLTSNRIVRSSGVAPLDRAAKNSIEASRLLPLPSDYGPNKVTMRTTFYYREKPTTWATLPERVPPPVPETPAGEGSGEAPIGPKIYLLLSDFDPMGADFSKWITQFNLEIFKNWNMRQPALMRIQGHGEVEFTVERDGRLSFCRVFNSSTNPDLDNAAKNALEWSHFLPLPDDYSQSSVTMSVNFFYNESPP